ncbi:hypothetical protein ABUE31_21755 [Mesorhizobium sp. ZMM04-5]|uniref:Lipoprotein n=1 Tax=Mesorhizobium marinum TaxID=3228790 RepID=A0ABV3R6B5_9HYPH
MRRWIVFAAIVIGGCQTAAEEPDQKTALAGDYRAVAGCFYRGAGSGYRSTEDPSKPVVTVSGTRSGGGTDSLEFMATGDGITTVHAHLGSPGGTEAWHRYLSILKGCPG